MLVVSPFASHVPVAEATATVAGPVMTKSLPLGAMDEQRIGDLNSSFNVDGEQATGIMLSMATGKASGITKLLKSPTATYLLQSPRNVFPSVPAFTCN